MPKLCLGRRYLALVVLIAFLSVSTVHAWCSDYQNWQYRRPVIINNTANSENLTDYQLFVNATYDEDMQNGWGDIRFTWYNESSGEEQPIPYVANISNAPEPDESLTCISGSYCEFYVKIPSIEANTYYSETNTTIFMYYSTTEEVNSTANASEVYDDFTTDIDISGGGVKYQSSTTFGPSGYILEGKITFTATDQRVRIGFDVTPSSYADADEASFYPYSDGTLFTTTYNTGKEEYSHGSYSTGEHDFKIMLKGSAVDFVWDGTTYIHSSQIPDEAMYVYCSQVDTGTAGTLNVLKLRKYTDPEPTTELGEEQSNTGAIITLNYPHDGYTAETSLVDFNITFSSPNPIVNLTLVVGETEYLNSSTVYSDVPYIFEDVYVPENTTWYAIGCDSSSCITSSSRNIYVIPNLFINLYDEYSLSEISGVMHVLVQDSNANTIYNIQEFQSGMGLRVNDGTYLITVENQTGNYIYTRRQIIDLSGNATVDFYLLSSENDVVIDTFQIQDLTGNFGPGSIIRIKKDVNGTVKTIHSDYTDIQNQVSSYLLRFSKYSIEVSNPSETRSIGDYVPDSSETVIITIASYTKESEYLFANVGWEITTDKNSSKIRLHYEDKLDQTSYVKWWIYNGSNTSQLLYSDEVAGSANVTMNYVVPDVNQTYYSVMEVSHQKYGILYDKRWISFSEEIGSGISAKNKLLASLFIVSFVAMIFSAVNVDVALVLTPLMADFFYWIDWLQVSSYEGSLKTLLAIVTFIGITAAIVRRG